MKSTALVGLAVTAVLALTLSACSSGTGDSGIVSLANSTSAPKATTATGTPEEQALAFAKCMRDNGIDFPDPTVDASGNPSFADAFRGGQGGAFDPRSADFRTAMTACQPLMATAAFGGGRFGGNFDTQAIQDALLTYTQCLRDQGLDVGDITFGNRAGGTGGPGAQPTVEPTVRPSGGPAAGERGPGGDPSTRFAEQLGQDPTDPAWVAANGVCLPPLTKAFTSASGGSTPGGTAGTQLGATNGTNG